MIAKAGETRGSRTALFSHPMPMGAKADALHQYQFHFYMSVSPIDHQVSRIFQFSIDPIFEILWYKPIKTMCAFRRADQCFNKEVQILCSSEALNYENFTIANIKKTPKNKKQTKNKNKNKNKKTCR